MDPAVRRPERDVGMELVRGVVQDLECVGRSLVPDLVFAQVSREVRLHCTESFQSLKELQEEWAMGFQIL
jgi:hypothetical protein